MALCLWRPRISTGLEYALQRAVPVRFTYEGRPREAGPVLCAVASTDRADTVLVTGETFIPGELNGRECRIYFKLMAQPDENAPGDKASDAKYGFYCRSIVLDTRRDDANAQTEIHIKTPFRALQRELRCHERLNIKPGMIRKFCFWFAPSLPRQRGQVHASMSRYSPEQDHDIRLIDLSAGGAFVQLVNSELPHDIDINRKTQTLLYLDCTGLEGESLKFLLAAHCVGVFRNKKTNAMNLHLQFAQQLGTLSKEENLNWQPVGESGISLLKRWVEARLKRFPDSAASPFFLALSRDATGLPE